MGSDKCGLVIPGKVEEGSRARSWLNQAAIDLVAARTNAGGIGSVLIDALQMLKNFLIWVKEDLGQWGPVMIIAVNNGYLLQCCLLNFICVHRNLYFLAFAYIPLTVLAVPAAVLTLGEGYLFGLPVGFIADSIGSMLGATVAFIFCRTIGRSYVISKLRNYSKFLAVAIASERSGFKIVFLLRLVPLLPFNMLNYLLSVTSVRLEEYVLASWLGLMPITFGMVYVGTTLKDLSDVTYGWDGVSPSHQVIMAFGFIISGKLAPPLVFTLLRNLT
ncbi:TVP38/TMEM64 family membrane protein slr0305-like [Hibiscus syriacus]|uniref:TVP38/TMEM64 family membrane protein slr0305-like n=1 Tax=Hibiscus syriacus TaxID=106335 RepID=UPI00192324BE|nr:TVP38/TMEM64 family membrane protein slr0305-like [Hibiscus syriacus]